MRYAATAARLVPTRMPGQGRDIIKYSKVAKKSLASGAAKYAATAAAWYLRKNRGRVGLSVSCAPQCD